ncbi:MAG: helix-turn-helix domain-containing protein [Patescibacteria group bacterium]|nr:hypothetical protein [Patescibacteria group bacterium]
MKPDYLKLVRRLNKIGLTVLEAKVYLLLVNLGSLTAKAISKELGVFPHTVYREIKKLEEKQLITLEETTPMQFSVLPLELALSSYLRAKYLSTKHALDFIISQTRQGFGADYSRVNVLGGKSELFETSEKLINGAKKKVYIISIGEPSTKELILANRRAVERGVVVQFIAHRFDEKNQEFLENLQKNGLKVRHFPDWGFHLVVVDDKDTLLSINNEKEIDKRVTMLFRNRGFSKAMGSYFASVWGKATPVRGSSY